MSLLNQTLNDFLIHSLGMDIKLNFDILNANLVNLALLDGGLIYILSKTLTESLFERKKSIFKAFEDSEEKLSRSVVSFVESFLRLNQVKLVGAEIQKNTEKVIAQSRSDIYEEGKFELVRLKDSALKQLIVIGAAKKRYLIDLIKGLVILRTLEEFKISFSRYSFQEVYCNRLLFEVSPMGVDWVTVTPPRRLVPLYVHLFRRKIAQVQELFRMGC